MEEINLDFQKENHKNLNVNSNLNSNVSDVNIMRDNSSSSLGVELLMNKSKASTETKVEEFKPSDPVVFSESKTHYYVCTPHLPSMKAVIVVN